MTFVPPTPDCKTLIALGKSATDLGWSQTFYERFCWQYGLRPVKAKESVASLIRQGLADPAPVTEICGDPFQDAVSCKWPCDESRTLTIEYHAGRRGMVRTSIEVERHEAAAMIALARAVSDEGWIVGADISRLELRKEKNTFAKNQYTVAYCNLNKQLQGTPLEVQTLRGTGVRLVYAKNKERAKVRVVKLGDIEIE